mgnify:CR=1 FL=1
MFLQCYSLVVKIVNEINERLAGTGVKLRITAPYRVGVHFGCIAHVTYPSNGVRSFIGMADTADASEADALTQAVKMITE